MQKYLFEQYSYKDETVRQPYCSSSHQHFSPLMWLQPTWNAERKVILSGLGNIRTLLLCLTLRSPCVIAYRRWKVCWQKVVHAAKGQGLERGKGPGCGVSLQVCYLGKMGRSGLGEVWTDKVVRKPESSFLMDKTSPPTTNASFRPL